MNLKHLTDEQIHIDTKNLVLQERELLNQILHYLMENDRRRLFSAHKKESLKDYAVSLGYSDDQAERRITAMRVLRECPAIEEKLATAELDLTHLLIARKFFNSEKREGRPLSAQKKEEVLGAMSGRPTREAFKIAMTFSPEPSSLKEILKLEVEVAFLEKLKELRGLRAHTDPGISNSELFQKLVREDIVRRTAEPKKPRKESKAEVAREVFRRDERKCANCGGNYALQIDHRIPKAAGGADMLDNFRLLCRNCNQRAGIEFYGQGKMDPHINKKTAASRFSDESLH